MTSFETMFYRWFLKLLLELLQGRGRSGAELTREEVLAVFPYGQYSQTPTGVRFTPKQADLLPRRGQQLNVITVKGINYIGALGDTRSRRPAQRSLSRGGGAFPLSYPYQPVISEAMATRLVMGQPVFVAGPSVTDGEAHFPVTDEVQTVFDSVLYRIDGREIAHEDLAALHTPYPQERPYCCGYDQGGLYIASWPHWDYWEDRSNGLAVDALPTYTAQQISITLDAFTHNNDSDRTYSEAIAIPAGTTINVLLERIESVETEYIYAQKYYRTGTNYIVDSLGQVVRVQFDRTFHVFQANPVGPLPTLSGGGPLGNSYVTIHSANLNDFRVPVVIDVYGQNNFELIYSPIWYVDYSWIHNKSIVRAGDPASYPLNSFEEGAWRLRVPGAVPPSNQLELFAPNSDFNPGYPEPVTDKSLFTIGEQYYSLVPPPADSIAGTVPIKVGAISEGDEIKRATLTNAAFFQTLTDTYQFELGHNVDAFTNPLSQVVERKTTPGEPTSFTLQIKNTGTTTDSYGLTVFGLPAGWTAQTDPTVGPLLPNQASAFVLEVTPPVDAPFGITSVTISAVSQSDNTAQNVVSSVLVGEDNSNLMPVSDFGLRFGNGDGNPGTLPSSSAVYTEYGYGGALSLQLELVNTGAVVDRFQLVAENVPLNWSVQFYEDVDFSGNVTNISNNIVITRYLQPGETMGIVAYAVAPPEAGKLATFFPPKIKIKLTDAEKIALIPFYAGWPETPTAASQAEVARLNPYIYNHHYGKLANPTGPLGVESTWLGLSWTSLEYVCDAFYANVLQPDGTAQEKLFAVAIVREGDGYQMLVSIDQEPTGSWSVFDLFPGSTGTLKFLSGETWPVPDGVNLKPTYQFAAQVQGWPFRGVAYLPPFTARRRDPKHDKLGQQFTAAAADAPITLWIESYDPNA